jgi:hypothetical protein
MRRERMTSQRKRSYDFQRRLANYMQKDLIRLDPDLPLPEDYDENAELTEEVAARYYMANHMIQFKNQDSWVTNFLRSAYDKLFNVVSPRERGVDPAIVEVFRNMETRVQASVTSTSSIFSLTSTRDDPRITMTENLQMGMRDMTRVVNFAPLIPIVFAVAKQWRWIVAAIVPVFSAPEFRVAARIGLNPYIDFMGNIYKEGLEPTFSLASLEEFGIDVGFSILDIILYVITSILRLFLCYLMPSTIQMLAYSLGMLLYIVGGPFGHILFGISTVFTGAFSALMPLLAYCPPVIELDSDGVPVLEPWNYAFAIVDCDPLTTCTDETDCPGMAPCRCEPPTTQWTSYFWSADGDFKQNCPADSGHCLCYPRVPCDFELKQVDLSEPFEQDCREEFGYRRDNIVWYQNPSFFGWLSDTLYNTYISLRFVSRTLIRGYTPFVSTSVILAVGLLLAGIAFAVQRYRWAITILIVMVAFISGSVLVTETTTDLIIPALERISAKITIISWLSDFILSLLRFDNATPADPTGSPQPGEFVCWLFNSATFWMGLFVLAIIVGTLAGLLLSGFLKGIFSFVLFWVMYPFRRIYDMASVGMTASSLEGMREDDDEEIEEGGYEEGGYGEGGYEDIGPMPTSVPLMARAPGLRMRFPDRTPATEPESEENEDHRDRGMYGPIPESLENEPPVVRTIVRGIEFLRNVGTAEYWSEVASNAASRAAGYGRDFMESPAMNENAWEMPDYSLLWRPNST